MGIKTFGGIRVSLVAVAALAGLAGCSFPRGDGPGEVVQTAVLSMDSHRVNLSVSLLPEAGSWRTLRREIDLDCNGTISGAEEQQFAHRVMADLDLTLDEQPLDLTLGQVVFPDREALRRGTGDIQLEIHASNPSGRIGQLRLERRSLQQV